MGKRRKGATEDTGPPVAKLPKASRKKKQGDAGLPSEMPIAAELQTKCARCECDLKAEFGVFSFFFNKGSKQYTFNHFEFLSIEMCTVS